MFLPGCHVTVRVGCCDAGFTFFRYIRALATERTLKDIRVQQDAVFCCSTGYQVGGVAEGLHDAGIMFG